MQRRSTGTAVLTKPNPKRSQERQEAAGTAATTRGQEGELDWRLEIIDRSLIGQMTVHGLRMRLGAGVVHHQMKGGAGVEGEALRKQRLDAIRNRAGQFINLVRADADGRVESVLWRKEIGKHVGLGEGSITVGLVGEIAAHIEIERRVGWVAGERRGALTCAMRRVVELHDAMERSGKAEIGQDRRIAPDELLVALGYNIETPPHQRCDGVQHGVLCNLHNDFKQSSSIVCNCVTVSRVSSPI